MISIILFEILKVNLDKVIALWIKSMPCRATFCPELAIPVLPPSVSLLQLQRILYTSYSSYINFQGLKELITNKYWLRWIRKHDKLNKILFLVTRRKTAVHITFFNLPHFGFVFKNVSTLPPSYPGEVKYSNCPNKNAKLKLLWKV